MIAELWDDSGVSERPSEAMFAGRDAELDLLWDAFVTLDATGARTVVIGGEAGIGKTRLIEELGHRARAAGALVAVGVSTPAGGSGLAFAPVVGVLRDVARQLDDSVAATVLAPARRAVGLDLEVANATHTSEASQMQRFEALLACLTALGARGPTIIVFEDLHWADSASLELIDFLARNLGSSPVLIIATYRNDEFDPTSVLGTTIAEVGRLRTVTQVELGGIDRDATGLLMREMLGAVPDWSLLDAVYGRSGGNPFFAEELTAARGAPTLPTTLRNVVMLRIERLSPDARAVTATIATAGLSIDHRVLQATCALDADRLHAATAEAVAGHVIAVDDGTRLRFCHALQREAVYESLLPTERTRLHHQLAVALSADDELLGSLAGQADGELALHWWEAGVWRQAMHSALRAGDAMAALLAIYEAHTQYERAIAAYERCSTSERADVDRVDLLVKVANMAYLVGETARALELVTIALDEADRSAPPERIADALAMFGRQAGIAGDTDTAFSAFERATALLPEEPTRELARVLAYHGACLMGMGHLEAAVERCREAIAVARATGARAPESHATCTLGVSLVELGEHEVGIEHAWAARDIAEELGLPDLIERAYGNLSHALMSAGRLRETAHLVENPINGERFTGLRLIAAGQNCAEALIRLGRFDDATDLLDRIPPRGMSACVYGPYALRAVLSIRHGQLDDAAAHLVSADTLAANVPAYAGHGVSHMLHAELLLERGLPDEAFGEIEQAMADVAGTDDHVMRPEMCSLGIRALADMHDAARLRRRTVDLDKLKRLAAMLIECAREDVEALTQPGRAAAPRVLAFSLQSDAEASRLDEPDADRWNAAAAAWAVASEQYPMAYCEWREAQAALATPSRRADGVRAATTAWSRARDMRADIVVSQLERLAQRARIPLNVDEPTATLSAHSQIAEDLGLTAREVEVLDQLARGRTDRQIADALFISKKTVSVHVSNILRKLDAGNRVDAGEIGQRVGLGQSPN